MKGGYVLKPKNARLRKLVSRSLCCSLLAVLISADCFADNFSKFTGRIVFDSNRSGSFGIYSVRMDGSDLRPIVDSDAHEIYPDPSPDGSSIVYARTLSTDRNAPSDIWIVDREGKNPRELAKNGSFPTFSADGETIFFERDRSKVMAVKREGPVPRKPSDIRKIFPIDGSAFEKYPVVKPRVSPDGKYVAFTSSIPDRWTAWYADLQTGKGYRMGSGCSPSWFSRSEQLSFVSGRHSKAGSGLYRFNRKTSKRTPLQDDGPPFGHEYYPTPSQGDRFLLYGACPADQHNQITSNYQIFLRDLQSTKVLRVTSDDHNNRWPKLLPPLQTSKGHSP